MENMCYNKDNDNDYHYRNVKERMLMDTKMTKRSKQRDAILSVLKNTKVHPTAEWLHNEVRKDIPNISLATVYRNMKLLLETKQIVGINIDGIEHYDGNCDNHYHFVCKGCSSVLDLDIPPFSDIEVIVEKMNNVLVDSHSTIFYGVCEHCRKSREA